MTARQRAASSRDEVARGSIDDAVAKWRRLAAAWRARGLQLTESMVRLAWVLVGIAAAGCNPEASAAAVPADAETDVVEEPPASEPAPAQAETALLELETVSADPPTGLALQLLATLAAEKPADGRATIRDEARGVIGMYRPGELLADQVRLVEVWPDYVVIENEGERERVSFVDGIASVRPDDVFYPDLVELDERSNTMADAVQLEDGPGYVVKKPLFAWGTPRTVAAIRQAVRIYASNVRGGPSVHVGDISKREGGPFPPHLSHQTGRDVDIGYVHMGPQADVKRFVTATRHSLDRERTWELLRALIETDAVGYIFLDYGLQRLLYEYALEDGEDPAFLASVFQYPRGSRAPHGIIRHWRGHANHFHVRFRK